jgi:hypothetical protein
VPYSPFEDKSRGFWSRLGSLFSPGQIIRINQEKFDKYKHSLDQRLAHVKMHITSLGLETVELDTQSLIELYYSVYNPEVAAKQKLADIDRLRLEE